MEVIRIWLLAKSFNETISYAQSERTIITYKLVDLISDIDQMFKGKVVSLSNKEPLISTNFLYYHGPF